MPAVVAVYKPDGAVVATVGQGTQHADDGCDTNTAGDENKSRRVGIEVSAESAIRTVEICGFSRLNIFDGAGEVAQLFYSEFQPTLAGSTG